MDLFLRNKNGLMLTFFISDYKLRSAQVAKHVWVAFFFTSALPPWSHIQNILRSSQCISEPPRGRVSAELSKPVERKGAMCVVLV